MCRESKEGAHVWGQQKKTNGDSRSQGRVALGCSSLLPWGLERRHSLRSISHLVGLAMATYSLGTELSLSSQSPRWA